MTLFTFLIIGLCWRLAYASEIDLQIVEETRLLMTKTLEEDSGISTGWTETGGLLTAHTNERLAQYRRNITVMQLIT